MAQGGVRGLGLYILVLTSGWIRLPWGSLSSWFCKGLIAEGCLLAEALSLLE